VDLYRSFGDFGPSDLKIDAPCWSWVRGRGCVGGGTGCGAAWESGSLAGRWGAGVCRASHITHGKVVSFVCAFNRAHNNVFLPCAGTRQTIFLYCCNLYKNYQINFKKFRKLTQIKLCCLLLMETSFEVKTQFEYRIAYKCNPNFRMKLHRRCFDF
jgi:hypothetical protein